MTVFAAFPHTPIKGILSDIDFDIKSFSISSLELFSPKLAINPPPVSKIPEYSSLFKYFRIRFRLFGIKIEKRLHFSEKAPSYINTVTHLIFK